METAYNSTHPYNFIFAVSPGLGKYADNYLTVPYSPYDSEKYHLLRAIYGYLKNVTFRYATSHEIRQRLWNEKRIKVTNEPAETGLAIIHGIIDSATGNFFGEPNLPQLVHIPPYNVFNSFVIISTVNSDARRESSETLSIQGLPSSVWALVGFSLLVVTGLATYFSFRNEKKNRRESPIISWMNWVWIYASDILNNCVAGVIKPGPGRYLRCWWLLGVVFLIQSWSAGMKSDLLVDHASFIDSLEDLLSKPELICMIPRHKGDPFRLTEDDPRYKDFQKMKKQHVDDYDENTDAILISGIGVDISQDVSAKSTREHGLIKKLIDTQRKKYIGKERYAGNYGYMLFNKRLSRALKEDINYLTSRLTETRQTENRQRYKNFISREYIFDPTETSASTMSWSALSVNYLSPVFRVWMIGNSLATFIFCAECFRSRMSRRRPDKVSPECSIEI